MVLTTAQAATALNIVAGAIVTFGTFVSVAGIEKIAAKQNDTIKSDQLAIWLIPLVAGAVLSWVIIASQAKEA